MKLGDYAETFYLKKDHDFLKVTNEEKILEASTSNIFFAKNDQIFTPKSDQKLLSCLTRQSIIKLFNVVEKDLYLNDLASFDVAFTTNSVALINPVSKIDQFIFKNSTSYSDKFINEFVLKYKKSISL